MTPHVRQTIADRELETWLVVDLSPSLDFGTVNIEKRDLVFAAATAISHLTAKAGNRIGAIVTNGEQTDPDPGGGGTEHARYLLRKLAATPRAGSGRRRDLAPALEQVRRPPRRRGMVVVISDFLGEPGLGAPAARARRPARAARHRGARPARAGTAGRRAGHLRRPGVRRAARGADLGRGAAGALRRRRPASSASDIASMLRRAGADHLRLRTDSDWLSDMVRFVVTRRRGVAVRPPSRAGMIGVH